MRLFNRLVMDSSVTTPCELAIATAADGAERRTGAATIEATAVDKRESFEPRVSVDEHLITLINTRMHAGLNCPNEGQLN